MRLRNKSGGNETSEGLEILCICKPQPVETKHTVNQLRTVDSQITIQYVMWKDTR